MYFELPSLTLAREQTLYTCIFFSAKTLQGYQAGRVVTLLRINIDCILVCNIYTINGTYVFAC